MLSSPVAWRVAFDSLDCRSRPPLETVLLSLVRVSNLWNSRWWACPCRSRGFRCPENSWKPAVPSTRRLLEENLPQRFRFRRTLDLESLSWHKGAHCKPSAPNLAQNDSKKRSQTVNSELTCDFIRLIQLTHYELRYFKCRTGMPAWMRWSKRLRLDTALKSYGLQGFLAWTCLAPRTSLWALCSAPKRSKCQPQRPQIMKSSIFFNLFHAFWSLLEPCGATWPDIAFCNARRPFECLELWRALIRVIFCGTLLKADKSYVIILNIIQYTLYKRQMCKSYSI